MMPDQPGTDEAANPAGDIAPQSPGEIRVEDLAKGKNDVSDEDMTGTQDVTNA